MQIINQSNLLILRGYLNNDLSIKKQDIQSIMLKSANTIIIKGEILNSSDLTLNYSDVSYPTSNSPQNLVDILNGLLTINEINGSASIGLGDTFVAFDINMPCKDRFIHTNDGAFDVDDSLGLPNGFWVRNNVNAQTLNYSVKIKS